MNSEVHTLTPAGKIKWPSYATVTEWVRKSWRDVDISIIQRSFKCCGISTARDGSEDNLIFDYDNIVNTKKINKVVKMKFAMLMNLMRIMMKVMIVIIGKQKVIMVIVIARLVIMIVMRLVMIAMMKLIP